VSIELKVPFNSFDDMDYFEFITQYENLADYVHRRNEAEKKDNGMVSIQNAFGG